jgi:hypothetical protein
MSTGLVQIFLMHDVTWDNGRWSDFPPAPWVIGFTIRKVLYYLHSDWWRFAPCDSNMRPQKQYAVAPTA